MTQPHVYKILATPPLDQTGLALKILQFTLIAAAYTSFAGKKPIPALFILANLIGISSQARNYSQEKPLFKLPLAANILFLMASLQLRVSGFGRVAKTLLVAGNLCMAINDSSPKLLRYRRGLTLPELLVVANLVGRGKLVGQLMGVRKPAPETNFLMIPHYAATAFQNLMVLFGSMRH